MSEKRTSFEVKEALLKPVSVSLAVETGDVGADEFEKLIELAEGSSGIIERERKRIFYTTFSLTFYFLVTFAVGLYLGVSKVWLSTWFDFLYASLMIAPVPFGLWNIRTSIRTIRQEDRALDRLVNLIHELGEQMSPSPVFRAMIEIRMARIHFNNLPNFSAPPRMVLKQSGSD